MLFEMDEKDMVLIKKNEKSEKGEKGLLINLIEYKGNVEL